MRHGTFVVDELVWSRRPQRSSAGDFLVRLRLRTRYPHDSEGPLELLNRIARTMYQSVYDGVLMLKIESDVYV